MSLWELSGEAGKVFGAAKVELQALGVPNVSGRLGSLMEDQISFSQVFASPDDVADGDIEEGQVVELWKDGNRIFSGHCTKRRVRDTSTNGLQVDTTVSGPWWWMLKTPLSGQMNDQAGGDAERIAYAFDTGDLKAHLTTLVNRMIALNVPINLGTISDCFDIPQITVKQMSCADALTELLRWTPDASCWVDYSGVGTPVLNITRRDDAPVETLTVGQPPLQSIDVNSRMELDCDQVVVTFVKRAVDGKTVYSEQISGHAGMAQGGNKGYITLAADASDSDDCYNGLEVAIESGTGAGQVRTISDYTASNKRAIVSQNWSPKPDATSVYTVGNGNAGTGKRQIVTVSGPELDSFLPNDLFDSFEIETDDLNPSGVVSYDPVLKKLADDHVTFADALHSYPYTVPNSTPITSYVGATPTMTLENGEPLPNDIDYVIIKGEPTEWMKEQYKIRRVRIKGTFVIGYAQTAPEPSYEDDVWDSGEWLGPFYFNGTNAAEYYFYEADILVWGIDTSFPAAETVYKDAEYAFIQPPEGMAANLQATQSFRVYEGELDIVAKEIGATEYRGKVVNILGSIPAHATMKSLVQSVSFDTSAGETSIQLGAPPRLSYHGLVNRFRRTASDNIVYL